MKHLFEQNSSTVITQLYRMKFSAISLLLVLYLIHWAACGNRQPSTMAIDDAPVVARFQGDDISWRVTAQHSVTFIFCFLILMASWILNATLISGMRRDRRLAHITYYYITSLCVAMIILASIDFPPTVIYETMGHQEYTNSLCIGWIYLDTLLCNVTFLHILSASLDSFLRLRNPRRYVDSTKKSSTWLKIAAPWSVSFIQSTAQFAIGHNYTDLFKEGVCLLNDPNFLILRTTMSFALPMIGSIILIIMSIFRLRAHKHITRETMFDLVRSYQSALEQRALCTWHNDELEFNDNEAETEPNERLPLHSLESCKLSDIADPPEDVQQKNTLTRALTTDTFVRSPSNNHIRMSPIPEVFEHHCPMHGLMSFPIGTSHLHSSLEESNYVMDTNSQRLTPPQKRLHCPLHYQPVVDVGGCVSCPKVNSGQRHSCNCNGDFELQRMHHHLLEGPQEQSVSQGHQCYAKELPTLSSKSTEGGTSTEENSSKLNKSNNHISVSWTKVYKNEKTAIAINSVTCLASIILWSPFIVTTFLYGICQAPECNISISYKRISDFKWISYSSAVAYAVLYLLIDKRLRRAASLALICSKPD